MRHVFSIAIDDMVNYPKFGTMYGVAPITPELDAFTATSTHFPNAVCAVPVCGQSRWSKVTGFTPAESGINYNQPGVILRSRATDTYTYLCRKAGFQVVSVGKYTDGRHQAANYNTIACDYVQGQINDDLADGISVDYGGINGTVSLNDPTDYGDLKVVLWWEDFLRNYSGTRPLMGCMGLFRPHDDYVVPESYYNLYSLSDFTIPADLTSTDLWSLPQDILQYELGRAAAPGGVIDPVTQADKLKRTVWGYFAALSFTSNNFGRLVQAIEDMCARRGDEYVIEVWSDHGFHLGSHFHWHKLTTLSEAANPPVWYRAPGQTVARTVQQPVGWYDMFQTVLDYAGVPSPARSVGKSLRPLIEGASAIGECYSITEVFGGMSALLESADDGTYQAGGTRYRVGEYLSGETVVFNDSTDWRNIKNIAGQNPTRTANLLSRLRAMAEQGGMRYANTPAGAARRRATMLVGNAAQQQLKGSGGDDIVFSHDLLGPGSNLGEGWDILWWLPTDGVEFVLPEGIEGVTRASENFWKSGSSTEALARLVANSEDNSLIMGWGASATVSAGAGDDYVENATNVDGGFGNDHIVTQWKNDTVSGGEGNDTIDTSGGHDAISGDGGDDVVFAGDGNDTIRGGAGNDSLRGDAGNDSISGGPGNDTLLGGAGMDTLVADGGADLLTGGTENDTFVILRNEQQSTITDFAVGDIIDLSAWSGIGPVTAASSGSDVMVSARLERLLVKAATVANVKAAIRGVTVA
ncbi:sulfatase-like hydrolase/transferase [Paracoccus suum]|nr:sulfatase-like hydrolase/transferase [Paracoccus suum]